jgi:tetratricopeptide (TPR) repeat protein
MAKSGWRKAVYLGLLAVIILVFVVVGLRFGWFTNTDRGAWSWIEAAGWVVGIGVGVLSLVIPLLERHRTARSARRARKLLDRDNEYERLRTLLSEGPWGVVTVVGDAGIGKSALVEEVVTDLRAEIPHLSVLHHTVAPGIRFDVRLLIANLRGQHGVAATLGEGEPLLGSLAAALTRTGQNRIVIIVEAAQHLPRRGVERHLDLQLDEAFDLIDSDRRHRVTVVLVTSEPLTSSTGDRRWLTPEASVLLSWLPREDFDTLLARAGLAGRGRKRRSLYGQLQGNPRNIALLRAASRLSAEHVDELLACLGPAATTEDLYALTVAKLIPPQQKVVHALAACATPVGADTVTAVLAGPTKDAAVLAALMELTDNRLVSRTSDEPHRYYLPVDDPSTLLPAESTERTTLLRRSADVLAAQRVANPATPDDLRMHFAQLRALLAARRYPVAYDVIEDINVFLKRWNCRFMLHAQREEVRGRLDEPFREMANDNELGFLYGETGQFAKASDAYGRALTYANDWGDPELRTRLRGNLGTMYWQMGKAESAFNFYEEARAEARSQNALNPLRRALLGLADCHRRWGEYTKAIGRAQEILDMTDDSDAAWLVRISLRLSRWYTETGNMTTAQDHLATAQHAAAGDPRLELPCLDAEADLLTAQEQPDKAKTVATLAVERALEVEDPVVILQARTTLCMVHLRMYRMREAAAHIEDAMRYRREGKALIVLALHALTSLETNPDHAPGLFADLADQARQRVKCDTRDFGAHDMLGFAICGQHLDTQDNLDEAKQAFDRSREITQGAAPFLLERRQFLVKKLDGYAVTPGRLAPVIQLLSGSRTQQPPT